jgi:methionyl-tRNA formyltransferase
LRIVFFGTPDAALPPLEALAGSRHEVIAVVTAPDRPSGRGMNLTPTPVSRLASSAGIPVIQPPTLRTAEAQATLAGFGADVFVVVAYGLLLPPAVLQIPPLGCINVHFSLLPLLRGAAPVQWALIQGHDRTGVTIMLMDPGMDTGPMLAAVEEPILPEDTAGTVAARLAPAGAELLLEVLDLLEKGEAVPVPQDDSLATMAPKLSAADAQIDWSAPADRIANRVRGFNPRPGAWATLRSRRLKILKVEPTGQPSDGPAGTLSMVGGVPVVDTGTEKLRLVEVQPEGKAPMTGAAFARGHRPTPGDVFS